MRKEATLEQWMDLYEVAINIKELKPWEYLWDVDIITLELSYKEPFYCSVMGRGGCFGIGAYKGFDAINNFYALLDKKDIPPEQMIRYQNDNIIMCYFGDREELTSKELKVIKDLGLKFRGKNNWIYFHSLNKGYVPYILDQEEVLQETEVLQNLYMALKAHIIEGIKIDFENGNTLKRSYNLKDELWLNYEAPIKIPHKQYLIPVLEDEMLISKLSKIKLNNQEWELDIAYLSTTVNDKKYDRPVMGRMCILADKKSEMIINQNMLTPMDDDIQAIFNIVIYQIMDYGKPSKIIVRDEYIYYILKDLCDRTKIKLEIKGRLKAIDYFIRAFTGGII